MGTRTALAATAALALGAAVVVLPAIAGSETAPAIEAVNYGEGLYGHHYWRPAQATLSEGATLQVANSTNVAHGVEWQPGASEEPKCTNLPVGKGAEHSGTHWNGTCTFARPGTYTFWCSVHGSEMAATVTVLAPAVTTPGTATTPTAPAGSGAPGAGGTPGASTSGSPLAGTSAHAISIAPKQHGSAVRGSVEVSSAGAGSRIEVDVFASRASLASAHTAPPVRVGKLARGALAAGEARFAVALDGRARRALRRHGRLRVSVRIVLRPLAGPAITSWRAVLLRR